MCQMNARVWCNYRTASDTAEFCDAAGKPSGEKGTKAVTPQATCAVNKLF